RTSHRRVDGVVDDDVARARPAGSYLVQGNAEALVAVDQIVADGRVLDPVAVDAVLAVVVNLVVLDQGIGHQALAAFADVAIHVDADEVIVVNDAAAHDSAVDSARQVDAVSVTLVSVRARAVNGVVQKLHVVGVVGQDAGEGVVERGNGTVRYHV